MSVSFREDSCQGVYHLHLGFDSPSEQWSVTATPFSGNYQGGPVHQSGAASAFVYLPNGQFDTDAALEKVGLPRPKYQYIGHGKHAALKEIIVRGKRILYYEYPSKFGHKCRLEIISAPEGVGPHLFDPCSRGSSKKARRAAEAALQEYVIQELGASQAQGGMIAISATDVATITLLDEPTPLRDPSPTRLLDEPSQDQKRQEEIEADLKKGLKGAYKVYGEDQEGDPIEEDEFDESSAKNGNGFRPAEYFKKLAQRVDDAAQDVLLTGRQESARGAEQLEEAARYKKVADRLDQKLQEGGQEIILTMADGRQKKLTRAQAEKLLAEARLKTKVNAIKGVDRVFRGTAKASVGHGVQSGVKRLGKELKQGHVTGLNALGSNLGAVSVDFLVQGDFSLEAAGGAAKEVVGQTVKGVGVQVAQNVAYSMAKGAVKEIAPALAKKIPGVTAINSVYSVGKAALTAKTSDEAFANGFNATVDTAISLGCTAGMQTLVPVPLVGAFLGSFVGSAVIMGKNWLFFRP